MIKKLTKHGNSLALVIDKAVLDLLNIDADTPLDVRTDGRSLRIEPTHHYASDEAVDAALADTNAKYGDMLKRLAE